MFSRGSIVAPNSVFACARNVDELRPRFSNGAESRTSCVCWANGKHSPICVATASLKRTHITIAEKLFTSMRIRRKIRRRCLFWSIAFFLGRLQHCRRCIAWGSSNLRKLSRRSLHKRVRAILCVAPAWKVNRLGLSKNVFNL